MLSRGRAVAIHPIHAILIDETNQGLRKLFARLVESLRRRVAILAENFVLRLDHRAEAAHQRATLARKIGGNFLVESGREKIAGTDGNAACKRAIHRLASCVLENSVGGVDAGTAEEVAADIQTRTLRCNHDDVNVFRRNDARLLFVLDSKAMGEVKSLALGQERLDFRPLLDLCGIRHEEHDNRSLFGGFLKRKERLSRNPSILDGTRPRAVRLIRFALADNDIESVVTHIQGLCRPLNAITENRNRLLLQDATSLGH